MKWRGAELTNERECSHIYRAGEICTWQWRLSWSFLKNPAVQKFKIHLHWSWSHLVIPTQVGKHYSKKRCLALVITKVKKKNKEAFDKFLSYSSTERCCIVSIETSCPPSSSVQECKRSDTLVICRTLERDGHESGPDPDPELSRILDQKINWEPYFFFFKYLKSSNIYSQILRKVQTIYKLWFNNNLAIH